MSEIRAGDLVMVVRGAPCCGNDMALGRVFTAGDLAQGWMCPKCAMVNIDALARKLGGEYGAPDSMLRRLDPDALKDDIPTRDEVPA